MRRHRLHPQVEFKLAVCREIQQTAGTSPELWSFMLTGAAAMRASLSEERAGQVDKKWGVILLLDYKVCRLHLPVQRWLTCI